MESRRRCGGERKRRTGGVGRGLSLRNTKRQTRNNRTPNAQPKTPNPDHALGRRPLWQGPPPAHRGRPSGTGRRGRGGGARPDLPAERGRTSRLRGDGPVLPVLLPLGRPAPPRLPPRALPVPGTRGRELLPLPHRLRLVGGVLGRRPPRRARDGDVREAPRRALPREQPRPAVPHADGADPLQGDGLRRPPPPPARHRDLHRERVPQRRARGGRHHHRLDERQPGVDAAHRGAGAAGADDAGGGRPRDPREGPGRHRGAQPVRLRRPLPHDPVRPPRRRVCHRAGRLGAALVPLLDAVRRAHHRLPRPRDRRAPRRRHLLPGHGLRRLQARPPRLRPQGGGAVLRLRAGGADLRAGRPDRAGLEGGPRAPPRLRPRRRHRDRAAGPPPLRLHVLPHPDAADAVRAGGADGAGLEDREPLRPRVPPEAALGAEERVGEPGRRRLHGRLRHRHRRAGRLRRRREPVPLDHAPQRREAEGGRPPPLPRPPPPPYRPPLRRQGGHAPGDVRRAQRRARRPADRLQERDQLLRPPDRSGYGRRHQAHRGRPRRGPGLRHRPGHAGRRDQARRRRLRPALRGADGGDRGAARRLPRHAQPPLFNPEALGRRAYAVRVGRGRGDAPRRRPSHAASAPRAACCGCRRLTDGALPFTNSSRRGWRSF